MKFVLSQSSYEVRDASEISVGLMVLGFVFVPVAIIVAALARQGLILVWPGGQPPAAIAPVCGGLVWLGAMAFVTWCYWRVARRWKEERRGGDMIMLVEGVLAIFCGLFASVLPDSASDIVAAIRTFAAVLMLLLLLCHAGTYCLLRYRPRTREIIVWSAMAAVLVAELARHA